MPILLKEDYEYPLPKLTKVQQIFDDSKIEDVVSETKRELEKKEISEKIHKGDRVAIAIGSRGISNLRDILKTLIDFLKRQEARPYIVSAMGSHGGGTEEGQKEVRRR